MLPRRDSLTASGPLPPAAPLSAEYGNGISVVRFASITLDELVIMPTMCTPSSSLPLH